MDNQNNANQDQATQGNSEDVHAARKAKFVKIAKVAAPLAVLGVAGAAYLAKRNSLVNVSYEDYVRDSLLAISDEWLDGDPIANMDGIFVYDINTLDEKTGTIDIVYKVEGALSLAKDKIDLKDIYFIWFGEDGNHFDIYTKNGVIEASHLICKPFKKQVVLPNGVSDDQDIMTSMTIDRLGRALKVSYPYTR